MSNIAQMMRAGNPVPDCEAALPSDEFDALLVLAQSRSGNMEVQELTKQVDTKEKPRNRWLIAAAAFAAVVIIGAVIALTTTGPSEGEPIATVTTPPTTHAAPSTTQAAPPTTEAAPPTTQAAVDPAALAVIEDLVAAYNRDDEAAMLALIEVAPDLYDALVPDIRREVRIGGSIIINECAPQSSGDFIQCRVDYTDRLLNGLSTDPRQDLLRVVVADGKITDAIVRGSGWHHETFGAWYDREIDPFYTWAEANHAGELVRIGAIPVWTDDQLATWAAFTNEYLTTLNQ